VVANICRMTHDWEMDLNDGHLAFRIVGQSHMVHYVDPLMTSIIYLLMRTLKYLVHVIHRFLNFFQGTFWICKHCFSS
jgi:hypothetical protein